MSDSTALLNNLPEAIRKDLFKAFNETIRNYREYRWEPSELNGGKLCEIIYTILRGYIDGHIPSKSTKPQNMVAACHALEQAPASTFPRSIRIQIPRMIIALYEIRNNRGVGHAGGDVDPNYMDATVVLYMSKWLIAELIRLFHNVDLKTASAEVNKIIERIMPIIWEVNGKYRVLDTTLNMLDKTLLILFQQTKAVSESSLVEWIEHSNPSVYRRYVLRKAHKEKLIEYNEHQRTAHISPKGINYVEKKILPSL